MPWRRPLGRARALARPATPAQKAVVLLAGWLLLADALLSFMVGGW